MDLSDSVVSQQSSGENAANSDLAMAVLSVDGNEGPPEGLINNTDFGFVTLADDDDGDIDDFLSKQPLREQDRFLPIANVSKIMKKSIPRMGKISKDAKECMQECVSEYISFITSEASERCQQEKRKTINGEDILCAMSTLGFDNYIEPLKLYLQKYRDAMKGEKTAVQSASANINPSFVTESIPTASTTQLYQTSFPTQVPLGQNIHY